VSSRTAEKQRRRQERQEWERQQAAVQRKRRMLLAGAGALALVAVGAVLVVVLVGGQDSKPQAATSAPFGPHYGGLERRRTVAGVPTMMQTMGSPVHFHPRLSLYADGRRMPVPANIGIDPNRDAMQMAGLHTHDATGTIHVEGVQGATLGQFFAIWGVALSPTRLGPYRATGSRGVRMWVNGRSSPAFGRLPLAEGQRIVIAYGSGSTPQPAG
jgi:hypothetical protein